MEIMEVENISGLSDGLIEKIQKVFEADWKVDSVLLFGSRAKGNYRENSDIDMALKGRNISFDDTLNLSVKLTELNLPYQVDLLNYDKVEDKELQEHIDRVGIVFYERWKKYKLSDLMHLIGGGTPKTTIPEYWEGHIPWLSVTDFNTGKKYCFDAEKKITERGLNESSTKILKKGQLIISARGTVGVLSVIGRDMAFNQSCYGIDAKEELTNNDFLYYLLKNNTANFHSASYGAVFDTITKNTFDHISVLIPDKPQQITIASTLSSLDDKIDLLNRQNKTLEDLAKTVFKRQFGEITIQGGITGKLSDVLELVYGKALKEEKRTGSVFPVIGSSGVVGYHSEYLVEGPGIVIGRKGTLGKVLYQFDNFYPIDTTYFIRSKVSIKGMMYEYFLLKSLNLGEMNSDSAVPGLNRNIALSAEIWVPPIEKISEFNKIIEPLFNKM